MTLLTRRSLLGGIGALLVAPAFDGLIPAPVIVDEAAFVQEGFQFSGFYSTLPLGQLQLPQRTKYYFNGETVNELDWDAVLHAANI